MTMPKMFILGFFQNIYSDELAVALHYKMDTEQIEMYMPQRHYKLMIQKDEFITNYKQITRADFKEKLGEDIWYLYETIIDIPSLLSVFGLIVDDDKDEWDGEMEWL